MNLTSPNFPVSFFILIIAFGCTEKTDSIKFKVIDSDYKLVQISEAVDITILNEHMESSNIKEFNKLILEQSNGDELIIEQKDEDGYLILLTLRHEQFVIESQPRNLTQVIEIMNQYLLHKDKIMSNIKFY